MNSFTLRALLIWLHSFMALSRPVAAVARTLRQVLVAVSAPRWPASAVLVLLAFALPACATARHVSRTVHDISRDLCSLYFGERQGISARDAARIYCATEPQLRPWLDALLKARAAASNRLADNGTTEDGAAP